MYKYFQNKYLEKEIRYYLQRQGSAFANVDREGARRRPLERGSAPEQSHSGRIEQARLGPVSAHRKLHRDLRRGIGENNLPRLGRWGGLDHHIQESGVAYGSYGDRGLEAVDLARDERGRRDA